jgi:cytochrome P450
MAGLRDIFREALRLYPPVGFLARECAADTTMRDKHVRKGSAVMVSPWLIHRHRGYWERPDDFDPGRFAREKPGMPLRDIYLPFGSGPRICIGAAFAMQEAVLILASLLLRYRFELAEGFVPQPVGRLTIRSENGMHMALKRRDGQ